MRPSLLFLLAPIILAAAPKDLGDLPISKLFEKKTASQAFLEKNPGAQQVKRGARQVHFLLPNGKRKALFGGNLTYKDAATGAWNLVAPVLSTSKSG